MCAKRRRKTDESRREALSVKILMYVLSAAVAYLLGTVSTGCYATGGQCCDNTITFSAKNARLNHYIINKVQIYGETPDVVAANANEFVKGDGAMRADGGEAIVIKDDGQAGDLCDRTFVDAVLTGDGSKILSPYADAVKSLAFTLACNRSMEENKPISIDEM